MSGQIFHKTELLKKNLIAQDVFELFFKKPDKFKFDAGQFVQLRFKAGEEELLRSYSLSSSPGAPDLQLCVKVVPGGKGSSYLTSIEIGTTIEMSNAKGRFISSQLIGNKYFIATGAGLAPIISMLESESKTGEGKLKLLFGVRNEKDLFWSERLNDIKVANSRFDYIITLSQPAQTWRGQKGRVTNHLMIDKNSHYFICGSLPMVKDVRKMLLSAGLSTKSIHLEIF